MASSGEHARFIGTAESAGRRDGGVIAASLGTGRRAAERRQSAETDTESARDLDRSDIDHSRYTAPDRSDIDHNSPLIQGPRHQTRLI